MRGGRSDRGKGERQGMRGGMRRGRGDKGEGEG